MFYSTCPQSTTKKKKFNNIANCSICLRNHLLVRQNCPSCFTDLHETQIKPNKIVQQIISLLKTLLPKMSDKVFNPGAGSNKTSASASAVASVTTPKQETVAQRVDKTSSATDTSSTSFQPRVDALETSQLFTQAVAGPSRQGRRFCGTYFRTIRCYV